MKSLRLRGPSPALVIALIALAVALSGGAYAAVKTIPGKDGVVHACYSKKSGQLRVVATGRCSRKEKALAFNQRGVTGPQGVQGLAGSKGDTGDPGPSQAYSVRPTSAVLGTLASPTTVGTLSLPAGSYVIFAKLWLQNEAAGSWTASAVCNLTAGGDSDSSRIQAQSTSGYDLDLPMSLNVNHTGSSAFSAVLTCYGSGGSVTTFAINPAITAIRVGALN